MSPSAALSERLMLMNHYNVPFRSMRPIDSDANFKAQLGAHDERLNRSESRLKASGCISTNIRH